MWRFLGRMTRAIFEKNRRGFALTLPLTAEDLLREKIKRKILRWQRHALGYELLEKPILARRCLAIAGSLRRELEGRTYKDAA